MVLGLEDHELTGNILQVKSDPDPRFDPDALILPSGRTARNTQAAAVPSRPLLDRYPFGYTTLTQLHGFLYNASLQRQECTS